ncbi:MULTISPECIES: hypothetical protein [unclassified Rhizobium]|nr:MULTISPECIES: hypothetical protein [unclassified Rhizobium]
MSRALINIVGAIVAAGLMTFSAIQYNAQVIREDKINQEIARR